MSKVSELISPERIWKESLLAKTTGLLPWRVAEALNRCGNDPIYRTCLGCADVTTFYYQCSLKFCPCCNWRISRRRQVLIEKWAKRIPQGKHVVLTVRNTDTLTRSRIRKLVRMFARLRRQRLMKEVKGGCVSVEITNEGRGWHLHLHCFIDARWIDAPKLAVQWGELNDQDYAIVKVKDCRDKDYLAEVTKYVVKPAQMVSWQPEEIAQFIAAVSKVRLFLTFGSLFKVAREIRMELARERKETLCKCGCGDFEFECDRTIVMKASR